MTLAIVAVGIVLLFCGLLTRAFVAMIGLVIMALASILIYALVASDLDGLYAFLAARLNDPALGAWFQDHHDRAMLAGLGVIAVGVAALTVKVRARRRGAT